MHLAYWSIAQTKNRETVAKGMGWELFLNYRIARDKYKPDYFLYENNKSMSPAIRAQITHELGVEPVLINSALVSAQNRQRLYWVGKRNTDGTYSRVDVEQPKDRGILLRDILETSVASTEKTYPLCVAQRGRYEARLDQKTNTLTTVQKDNLVAEPIRIGTVDPTSNSQAFRVYSPEGKVATLCGNVGGASGKTGRYAVPINETADGKARTIKAQYAKNSIANFCGYTSTYGATGVAERTDDAKKTRRVYEVRDGKIKIGDREYPIKLADGHYVIRKLTVTECKRLQTVPDSYEFPVSDSQSYKMLGNGWTCDVIAHIMSHFDFGAEPVAVLSMYDGMSSGMVALNSLGVNVANYWATEIDKYCIKTVAHNFPNVVQLGDAFDVRTDKWKGLLPISRS